MFKFFIASILMSGTAHAATIGSCEYLFRNAPGEIEFPNTVETRILPTGPVEIDKNKNAPQTPVELQFKKSLELASQSYSIVKASQLLPMIFKYHEDGHYFERIVDWNALIGLSIVGYRAVGFEYLDIKPGVENNQVKKDRLYFAGVVTAADYVNQKLFITLKTPSGSEVNLEYWDREYTLEPFLVLAPKTSPEELLRRSFKQTSIENFVGEAFGTPSVKEDYDIASAVVETTIDVPTTFGRTAVLKILLGRTIRGGEAYAHYGIARGKKRYTEKNLKIFIEAMYVFMESAGVMEADYREVENDRPEWLQKINKSPLTAEYKTIWQELRAEKGGAEKVIVEKRARSPGNLRLSRDVAKPGTLIAVKSEKDFKGTLLKGKKGFPIEDGSDQGGTFVAPYGKVLEIVKAPRRVTYQGSSYSLIRLRDPDTGREGEVFWAWVIDFTSLKPAN